MNRQDPDRLHVDRVARRPGRQLLAALGEHDGAAGCDLRCGHAHGFEVALADVAPDAAPGNRVDAAVAEYDPSSCGPFRAFGGSGRGREKRWCKVVLPEWRKICEAPVLIRRRGHTGRAKMLECALPQILEPRQSMTRESLARVFKALEERSAQGRELSPEAASSSSQP